MELFYYYWNQPDPSQRKDKKIVLLHGMGGTGALWRPIAAHLETEMSVLAFDQRGHGKSQVAQGLKVPGGRTQVGYTPLDYGKDVIEGLGTLSFHPTWIVGHSMGVRTAVAAAHLRPDWVQGLVLIDLGFSGVAGGGLGENLATFLKLLPTEFASREEAKAFMATHCPDPSMAQYLMAVSVRSTEKGNEGRISFPFDHAALIQTITAARDVSVKTWVKELATRGMPILVLRGERSLVWSHEEFENEKQNFSEYPSVKFLEIANAGHGLPFEQRQVFLEVLRDFM